MLGRILAARTVGGRGRRAEMGDFGGAGRGSVVRVVGGQRGAAEHGRRAVEPAGEQRTRSRLGGGVCIAGRRSLGLRGVGVQQAGPSSFEPVHDARTGSQFGIFAGPAQIRRFRAALRVVVNADGATGRSARGGISLRFLGGEGNA